MNSKKVICSCCQVTKGDIAKAIRQGAASFGEVKAATNVSKRCGKCKAKAKKTTKKLLQK